MRQHRVLERIGRIALVLGLLGLSIWAFSLSIATVGGNLRNLTPAAQSHGTPPFTITSPDFQDGGRLPRSSAFNQFGCPGKNIAPTLNWRGVPQGTVSFALEVTDYDAPVAGGFHHWILYNIPANVRSVNGHSPFTPGTNSFGLLGYGGPCPPATGQLHHYIFTLYALTIAQISGQALNYGQLIHAIRGHVAGATVIVGTFEID